MIRNSGDEQILRWSDPVLPRTLYAKAFELAGVDLFTLAARVTIVGGTVQALLSLGTAGARRIELGLTAASEPYARGMAQVVLGAAIGDGSHDIAWIVEPSGQVTCIVDGVVQDSEVIVFGPLFDRLVIGESCVGGSAWAGSASELYLYRLEDEFSIPGMLGSDAIVTSLPPTVSILFPLPAESFDIYLDGSSLTVSGLCSLATSVLVEMDSGSGYTPFATDAAPGVSSFTATGSLLGFLGAVNIRATATGPGGSTPSTVVSITVTPSSYKDVVFDGVNEYVDAQGILAFDRLTPFTFSFWIMQPSVGAMVGMVIGRQATGTPFGFSVKTGLLTATGFAVGLEQTYSYPSYWNNVYVTDELSFDIWYHAVVSWDGNAAGDASGISISIDGLPVAVTIYANTLGARSFLNPAAEIYFGSRQYSPVYIKASLDEICAWNKELSAAEVAELYNSGDPFLPTEASCADSLVAYWPMGENDTFPTLQDRRLGTDTSATYPTIVDASGSGYNGTMTNMAISDIVLDSPGGTFSKFALEFDGSNDHIRCGDVLGFQYTDAFSAGGWFRASVGNGYIVAKMNSTPTGWGLSPGLGYMVAYVQNSGTYQIEVRSSVDYTDGNWHFAVFTYDGSGSAAGLKMYVDGIEDTVIIDDALGGRTIQSTAEVNLGARTNGSALYTGTLGDVSVWNRVLTPAEVLEIYNGGVPTDLRLLSSAANLVGYWRMGNQVRFDGTMTNMEAGDIETRTF